MSEPAWWPKVIQRLTQKQQQDIGEGFPFPGAAFGIDTASNNIQAIGSIGQANGWKDNTICEIGSTTKTFTAAATLMALKEHLGNAFNADVKVHTLPGMEAWKPDKTNDLRKSNITVRQLLQHRTGLPYFVKDTESQPCVGSSGYKGSPGLTNECILVSSGQQPARGRTLNQISNFVMTSPKYPLIANPDSQTNYSNLDYIVAGRIVEKLSGMPLDVYLKQRIFDRIGMNDSFFFAHKATDAQRQRIANVVNITPDKNLPPEFAPPRDKPWNKLRTGWNYVWPEGGMYSTVADLLKFLGLLRNHGKFMGQEIIPDSIVKLMLNVDSDAAGNQTVNTLGFRRGHEHVFEGVSQNVVGHYGRFMTYFWYDKMPDKPPVLGVYLSQRITYVAEGDDGSNLRKGAEAANVFTRAVYKNLFG
jgi:CubicO group peptidase (beta-lactamase class C family)